MTISIALMLSIPVAAAWSSYGANEPSTAEDREDGWMYSTPDIDPNEATMKVYFNAWASMGDLATDYRAENPNFGILGSRVLAPNMMGQSAYLGIWKDCNNDGYIGHFETALETYPAVLLLEGDDICPAGGAYNDGEDVTEFKPIARGEGLDDETVQVWGDFGKPGGRVHFDCPHSPFPYGTSGSTGGVLMWADCFTAFTITRTITELDTTGMLGFSNPYHPERECDSALQQDIPVWGNPQREEWCGEKSQGLISEEEDESMGTVYDCDNRKDGFDIRDPTAAPGERGQLSGVNDPTEGELSDVFDDEGSLWITDSEGTYRGGVLAGDTLARPSPNPQVTNPEGSALPFLNNAEQGARRGCDGGATFVELLGGRMFGLESNFGATNPADGKRGVDFPMEYFGGQYYSLYSYLSPTYNGGTVRNDLQPAGAIYFTFYASLGANVTSIASSSANWNTGEYASEACVAGNNPQWDCNASNWYNTSLGAGDWDGPGAPIVPGSTYHLRDVDCYDGAIFNGLPVYASLAAIADEDPCADE